MKHPIKPKQSTLEKQSLEEIRKCLLELGSKNGMKRQKARMTLVRIGEPAIDFLTELTVHPQWQIRWEAVKTLSDIRHTEAIPVLINSLDDSNESVRWIAAEGLIALGKKGLAPLLRALISYKLTPYLRQGAHHVLNALSIQYSLPNMDNLLHSLNSTDKYFNFPLYAKALLDSLEGHDQNQLHGNVR